jgi:hypothetical protein
VPDDTQNLGIIRGIVVRSRRVGGLTEVLADGTAVRVEKAV